MRYIVPRGERDNEAITVEIPAEIAGYAVTEIGDKAFINQTAELGRVVIPEGVTAIGAKAFSGCDGIREVVLPSTLKVSIGNKPSPTANS